MEKIWLKHYPKDIPTDINPDQYQSLADVIDTFCKLHKDAPAFYNLGVTLSYHQIDMYSHAMAAYFQHGLNLKKGDRVAIMLPNVLQYPIVIFGALRAGLIVVNVNPLYTPPELIHQLKDSGAETIIVLANFAETVRQSMEDIPHLKNVIVTQMGDMFPRLKGMFIDFYLKYVKKAIPAVSIPNVIHFRDALAQGKKFTFNPVQMNNQDVAFLQYTGGTTGVSKGAMLTHRNIIANVMQAETWFKPLLKARSEVIVTALPLYHIFSLTANCMFGFKIGSLNILITNPRDTNQLISDMKKFKFTVITGVNTLFNLLMKQPEFAKLDFSHMRLCLGGGMAVQKVVAEKWQKMTGTPILEGYGLTESSPCITLCPWDMKEYTGTVGQPVPSTEISVLDENTGKELGINESGELAAKGPQVMYGYWRNPAETQKVFNKDGWLLTGDIGYIDENGFVYIRERKKDMILVSGFNVYPNEIEDVLVRLQGVREVAVIGVPDENSGEVVKAFIVKDDPALTIEDVLKYCHKNLTGYKIPRHIEFAEDLPKSNVGKILRRVLRDQQIKKTETT